MCFPGVFKTSRLPVPASGAPGAAAAAHQGGDCVGFSAEDQLFRSVEGQAASDEEEEEEKKWAGDQPAQVDPMKKIAAKLPCCGSG